MLFAVDHVQMVPEYFRHLLLSINMDIFNHFPVAER